MMRNGSQVLWALLVLSLTASGIVPAATVKGRLTVTSANTEGRRSRETGAVVWLTPLPNKARASSPAGTVPRPRVVQRKKRFETRLLAVQVGSIVDFPNLDPFFHNVFSLFEGTPFDLGLYEAGSTRSVRFDRAGVSYIFCNIHSEMSATVVVVNTPYFAVLNSPGEFEIPQVPPGAYQLNLWAERYSSRVLRDFSRQVTITETSTFIGEIRLPVSDESIGIHSNKYGKEYDPQVFSNSTYPRR